MRKTRFSEQQIITVPKSVNVGHTSKMYAAKREYTKFPFAIEKQSTAG